MNKDTPPHNHFPKPLTQPGMITLTHSLTHPLYHPPTHPLKSHTQPAWHDHSTNPPLTQPGMTTDSTTHSTTHLPGMTAQSTWHDRSLNYSPTHSLNRPSMNTHTASQPLNLASPLAQPPTQPTWHDHSLNHPLT